MTAFEKTAAVIAVIGYGTALFGGYRTAALICVLGAVMFLVGETLDRWQRAAEMLELAEELDQHYETTPRDRFPDVMDHLNGRLAEFGGMWPGNEGIE